MVQIFDQFFEQIANAYFINIDLISTLLQILLLILPSNVNARGAASRAGAGKGGRASR